MGDEVFLKIQPYVQSSLAPRSCQKLAFKYFGPFRIVDRIGEVAYKLELPDTSSIHPVFHVSQLKKSIGNRQVISSLPDSGVQFQVPEAVLQRRVVRRGDKSISQVLVKWNRMPQELST